MSFTHSAINAQPHPAWSSLSQIASDDITRLLEHFYSSTDNLLYDLSKRAETSTEAAFYFDAMRELRTARNSSIDALLRDLKEQMNGLAKGQKQPTSIEQNLSLLMGNELERVLACETVVNNVKDLYYDELSLLVRRLTPLCPLTLIAGEQFPLSPHWLAHSFAKVIPALNGNISVIIFKQFEKHILRQLEPLFTQCNEYLVHHNYIKQDTPFDPLSRSPVPKLSDIPTSLDDPLQSLSAPMRFTLPLHSLRQILANARFQAANDSSLGYRYAFNPGPVVPLSILNTALTSQQQQSADVMSFPLKNQVGDYVQRALEGKENSAQEANALNPYHEDIIQLVGAFFDELLEDEMLTTISQSLICRLQIPVLKVSLRNEVFFTNEQHPAREYINLLTQLSQTLEFIEHPNDDPLYSKLLNSVKRINKRFEINEDIFASELETLKVLEGQERKRADVIELRTCQAEEGKARFSRAKEAASECIEQYVAQQDLHNEIKTFIEEYWHQILVLTFIKEGSGSQWLLHTQTLNDLLWLDQEHADDRTQNRALELRKTMPERLEAGLSLLHITQEQSQALTENVLAATQSTSNERSKLVIKKTAIDIQRENYASLEQEHFNLARDMEVGTWVKYRIDSSHTVCKLASKDTNNHYLFVNRLGMKKINKTRQAFAMDLQNGLVSILGQEPIFDRLMNRALAHLKKE